MDTPCEYEAVSQTMDGLEIISWSFKLCIRQDYKQALAAIAWSLFWVIRHTIEDKLSSKKEFDFVGITTGNCNTINISITLGKRQADSISLLQPLTCLAKDKRQHELCIDLPFLMVGGIPKEKISWIYAKEMFPKY